MNTAQEPETYTAAMAMEELQHRLEELEARVEQSSGIARFEAERDLEDALQ